jgi:hypothetical protein
MMYSTHSNQTVYIGYTLAERAYQRAAWLEAMADLNTLRLEWIRRAAKAKRKADKARLEAAVTQMADRLAKRAKPPQAADGGRELPFMLERRVERKPVTGVRCKPRRVSLYMSQVAGLMGV